MSRSDLISSLHREADRPAHAQYRLYGALRTALITYGIAAYTYLLGRGPAEALGIGVASHRLVLVGLVLQLLLLSARFAVRRRAPDAASAGQALMVIELLADGVTVMLFALATLGAVMKLGGEI